jgi:choline-sulfatase
VSVARDRRPNVLILLSDQHAATALGCYGNPQVETPALDALAAGGVRFDAAYSACPVCVPGRFALYTGRYTHSLETVRYPAYGPPGASPAATRPPRGPAALSLREPTLAHRLRDAGYVTGFVGKLHPVAPHTYGFDYYVDFGHYADYLGPRQATFARGMQAVDSGCGVPWIDTLHAAPGGPWEGAPLPDGAPAVFVDPADHQEGFAAREAVRFLRAYQDEPFCLVVSFLKPHAPWTPAPEFAARYDPERLTLPPEPGAPLPRAIDPVARRFWQPHETWPLPPPGDPRRDAAARRWLAAYYACVTQMDAAAGEVLTALDDLGLRERTLVLYTSDHGEMGGAHGLYQKFVFFEGSVRVPFIVRSPEVGAAAGSGTAGAVAGAAVDHGDVVPTVLDLCGLPPGGAPRPLQGASLAPLLRQPARETPSGKGFAFSEFAYPGGPAYMLRAGRWKYVHYTGSGERALFDIARDPDETTNLAAGEGAPGEAAGIEAELRRRLLDWLPAHLPR